MTERVPSARLRIRAARRLERIVIKNCRLEDKQRKRWAKDELTDADEKADRKVDVVANLECTTR